MWGQQHERVAVTDADPGVEGLLLLVVLVRVDRVESDLVVRELSSDLKRGRESKGQVSESCRRDATGD